MGSRKNRWRRHGWGLIALTVAGVLTGGCGGQDEGLVVLCGGSMRVPIEKICKLYERKYGEKVTARFGGSGTLLAQIRTQGEGDVYCCHDPFGPNGVEFGALEDAITVATIFPCIVVSKGSDLNVTKMDDLAQRGLKVGLPDYEHTSAGNILREMLKKKGIFEKVDANQEATQRKHSALAQQVSLGNLDAAVIWDAVARNMSDKLDMFEIPDADRLDSVTSATGKVYNTRTVAVTLSVVAASTQKAAARRFVELALSEEGRRIWAEAGFNLVAPTTQAAP